MTPDSTGALRIPFFGDVFTDTTIPVSPSTGAGPWSETISGLSIPKSSANARAVSLDLTFSQLFVLGEKSAFILRTFLVGDATAATPCARCKDV